MPAMDYAKVADLYDAYVQTELDLPFFLQAAQGCRKVLELTSGTGRLSLPLIQAGVALSCLDSSPAMLAVLRQKLHERGLSAPVYEMDMTGFALPEKFDLVIIPFNAFAEICPPEAQAAALAAIRAHLEPGGRLVCTLHNPAVRLKLADGLVHWRGKFALPGGGCLSLSSVESYDPAARLVKGAQFYELYDPVGLMASKRLVDLQFYVHTPEGFAALAAAQGFRAAALYGDYQRAPFAAGTSPFMIWELCL